jgi:DNA-directed RNA polymerase subunit RPC12/RpoP
MDRGLPVNDPLTTRMPRCKCLNCGKEVDAATISPTETEIRRPQEGDATVCLWCSHIMVFTADLTMRSPTPVELLEIADDPGVITLLQAMGKLRDSPLWRTANEVLQGRSRKRRMVRAKGGTPDGEQFPQDRDPEGSA